MQRFLILLVLAAAPLTAQTVLTGDHVGLVPLTDLGTGTYTGYEGGLYPGGANTLPSGHASSGQSIATSLQPLNAAGAPDANGKIVVASLGMCNTTTESQFLLQLLAGDSSISPKMKFVDGAEGGMTADKLGNPAHAEHTTMWGLFDQDIQNQGVTPAQLQVVWLKITTAWAAVPPPKTFPGSAQWLSDLLKQTVLILKQKYPSVKMVFISSRVFAGYAQPGAGGNYLNPEPYAYENGFSVKWLIEQQINGDASLAYTGSTPPAPWISWGPYMWTDGLGSDGAVGGVPGRSDGLEWLLSDMANDGTHPSQPQGATKVAQLVLDFFKTDNNTAGWFLANPPATLGISTASLPGVEVNQPYSQLIIATATGATAPYAWSLASGSLPPGLVLDTTATGLTTSLSGTPTATGTYSFTVQIADSAATPNVATQAYSMIISAPASSGSGDSGGGGSDGGGCSAQHATLFLLTVLAVLPVVAIAARRRQMPRKQP